MSFVRLYGSISAMCSSLLSWITNSHPQSTFESTTLVDILGNAVKIQGTPFVKSVGDVLAEVVKHKDDFNLGNNQSNELISNMDIMRTLLLDFYKNLEPTAPLFDQMSSTLQHLRPKLVHVIQMLQQCCQVRSQYRIFVIRRRRHLLKEVEKYGHDMKPLLGALRALITPNPIYETSLDKLTWENLDIHPTVMPQRYRFVDCNKFTEDKILRIDEYMDLSHVRYSAISYVWRGNSLDQGSSGGDRFAVRGAEEADPISIDTLNHACTASLQRGFTYLWLDRLCIMQTNNDDKHWQISQMFRIYQSCGLCIVLAGGVQRLVRLDEETTWIHRGWTLQEVLAPAAVVVLFAWKLGPGKGRAGDAKEEKVDEVISRQSAMASLRLVVDACVTGTMSFTRTSGGSKDTFMVETKIFSDYPYKVTPNDVWMWRPQRKLLSPNVAALAITMSEVLCNGEPDTRNHAIWQSALMRTSSRPVDMVFSIMGLFGIILDTRAFHKNDRIGATIALAKEILNRGGSASWLGASFRLDPCKHLSTFSKFPRTRVAGKALVETKIKGQFQEVSNLMSSEYPRAAALKPMPQGTMDSDGYLTFASEAIQIVRAVKDQIGTKTNNMPVPTHLAAVDGSIWMVHEESESADSEHGDNSRSRAFAVLLGWFNKYHPGATPAHDANNIRAMLIEEHAPEKFHLRSFFLLSRQSKTWVATWEGHTFCVGGPEDWRHSDQGDENDKGEPYEISVFDKQPLPTTTLVNPTLEDLTIRAARWAVPQSSLEKNMM